MYELTKGSEAMDLDSKACITPCAHRNKYSTSPNPKSQPTLGNRGKSSSRNDVYVSELFSTRNTNCKLKVGK